MQLMHLLYLDDSFNAKISSLSGICKYRIWNDCILGRIN